MIDTKELRRLAQAATPHVGHACKYQDAHWLREGHVDFENADLFIASERPQEDAAFYAAANPAAISELLDRIEAAEKDNRILREALAEKVTSETMLRDLSVRNGSINATFEGGAMHLLVDAFANQFEKGGAANYIEMQFHSEATGPLVATLQRVNGKTPHQLRAEAEQERDWHAERCEDAMNECDALRAKIAEMEKQEPFDADSDVFRSAFEAALKAGNWPAARQGDGYRSPSTQIAWRIAFSTVNRLKLYPPGTKGEKK